MAYIDKVAETYPSPMRVWMGPNLYIFVHDADSVNKLLHSRTSLDKPDVYAAVRDALGSDGLFSSKGIYLLLPQHSHYHKHYILLWIEQATSGNYTDD